LTDEEKVVYVVIVVVNRNERKVDYHKCAVRNGEKHDYRMADERTSGVEPGFFDILHVETTERNGTERGGVFLPDT
jgi:hypothetical protein